MRKRVVRHVSTSVALLVVTALAVSPALADRPRVYALTGATVVVGPGQTIDGGTVVIRDGLIEAVGVDAAVPPDAEEIDAAGLWIYPGLIDPRTTVGIAEEPPERGDSGSASSSGSARRTTPSGAHHPIPLVHPENRVIDKLKPFEGDRKRSSERRRNLGFTVALVVPEDGVFRGRSVAILLQDDVGVPDLVLAEDVAQHVGFERSSFGRGYPTSLMGTAATIRQTLLDARRHDLWAQRYAAHPVGMKRPETVTAYEALGPVLSGTRRVVFDLDVAADFDLAVSLAEEFDLDAVVAATGDEWEFVERVAASGKPLILPVSRGDKPKVDDDDNALDVSLREMRRWLDAPEGPARFHEAGVEFAFTTYGLKSLASFRKSLEKILEAGLPEEVALAALTTVPAKILGVDAVVGTLQPGKIANLVVTDGPLFDKDTAVQRVFVDGTDYRIEKKKKPKGDPNAVVDPRGEWSVVFEFGRGAVERVWIIGGERDSYTGTAETRSGIVAFEEVNIEGNVLTVTFPARGRSGTFEITVVVRGDSFEGSAEMGPRSVPVKGTRVSGPEGSQR